jgi:hypothetical protein
MYSELVVPSQVTMTCCQMLIAKTFDAINMQFWLAVVARESQYPVVEVG